jgi:hypothetical protein
MAHVFVVIEGRELWVNLFLEDLLKRRYSYPMMNGMTGYIEPNPREIRLFDITIPEASVPQLMSDLAPFSKNTSLLRGKAYFLRKLVLMFGKLKPVDEELYPFEWKSKIGKKLAMFLFKKGIGIWKEIPYKSTYEVRHKWLNIIPIGYGEDHKEPNTGLVCSPKGGELI